LRVTADDRSLVQEKWDVLVVGAGPAGGISALELARTGLSVLLVDRAVFPRGKVCGCCLNMVALRALQDAGVFPLLRKLGARELREFRVSYRGRHVSIGLPGGYAISREVFDQALVDCALTDGAHFVSGAKASLEEVRSDGCVVTLSQRSSKQRIYASVVLCADGLNGTFLAKHPRYAPTVARSSRIGISTLLSNYSAGLRSGAIGMAVGGNGYVGMVEVEDGRLNLAAAVDTKALQVANHSPDQAVKTILEEAQVRSPQGLSKATWKGTPPLTRRRPLVGDGRLVILGDAAGYVEPFTGEGMAWALVSGRLVVPMVIRLLKSREIDLGGEWQQLYRKTIRRRQITCRLLQKILRTRGLIRCIAPASHLMHLVVGLLNKPFPQEPTVYES
jgi:flavin-dependent dehydrogenase